MGFAVIPLRQSALESTLQQEAFEHLPFPCVCLNASAQILAANRAFARMVGVVDGGLVGCNLAEFPVVTRPREFPRRWARFWRRLLERRSMALRIQGGTPRSGRRTLDISASMPRGEGETVAILLIRESGADVRSRLEFAQAAAYADPAVTATLLLAADRRVLTAAGRTGEFLGVRASDAQGVPFEYLLDEATAREFLLAADGLPSQPIRAEVVLSGMMRNFADGAAARRIALTVTNFIGVVGVDGILVQVRDARADRIAPEPAKRLGDRLLQMTVQSQADFLQSLAGILQSSADALRASIVGFWRTDRATGSLVCVAVYSCPEQRLLRDWVGMPFPDEGIVDSMARLHDRVPIAVADLGRDDLGRRGARWRGIRAFLSAPVLIEGVPAGVLAAADTVPRRWTDEEVGFIASAGLMVSLTTEAAQRAEVEGRIEQLSWYDALTGLPNRNLLRESLRDVLSSAAENNTRVGLLLIDLDRFKDVNDTLGHLVGDSLIKSVANVLRQLVGREGVARLGGDEFLVVYDGFSHRQEVAQLATQVAGALHRSDFVPNVMAQVSASIGVALYPEHGREIGTLLKYADAAMYQAKRDGGNQVRFFNPIRYEREAQELRLGVELARAVQEESPQLFLEYQPQVDIATRRVVGLEALVRWRHPVRGVLMPDRFIEAAETGRLSERITAWVMHETCAQIKRWRDAHPQFDIPVSVNVAGREFGSNALPALVRSALLRYGVDPRMVNLEVTERTMIQDGQADSDVIGELRALGVGLVLDDFGTGYSTLGYLRRLPLRAIKIDRMFVEGLPDDPDGCAIVHALLTVARHFRLAVVAEGVEREEQAVYLLSQGCAYAQGNLFARSLSAAAIEALIA